MVEQQDLEDQFARGHEVRSFEVKGPGSLVDKAFVARISRAAMALGNHRDGGLLCIGIGDTTMTQMLPGLDAEQFDEWKDFDHVSAALARYSDPPVTFRPYPMTLTSGAKVVVLAVAEFEQVPHICKRDYPGVLQAGAIYVRSLRQPESVPVPSSAEMHELLDLATNKALREFVARASAAGLTLGTALGPTKQEADAAAFGAEADRGWSEVMTSEIYESILVSAHFDAVVRPWPYGETRIAPAALDDFLRRNTVRLRGWPVPFIDNHYAVSRHGAWIGQEHESPHHREAWRLFTSGQFLHRCVLVSDLSSQADLAPQVSVATGSVVVWDVLLYSVELVELAARFCIDLGVDEVGVDLALVNIAGRELVSGAWERELNGPYLIQAETLETRRRLAAGELLADPRGIAVSITQSLCGSFGLNVPDQVYMDWQEQIFSGR